LIKSNKNAEYKTLKQTSEVGKIISVARNSNVKCPFNSLLYVAPKSRFGFED